MKSIAALPGLLLLLLSNVAWAQSNSTTSTTTLTTSTLSTSTSTSASSTTSGTAPQPTHYQMECGSSIQGICEDLCQCSGGQCACHADPTSRCQQMCKCVPS